MFRTLVWWDNSIARNYYYDGLLELWKWTGLDVDKEASFFGVAHQSYARSLGALVTLLLALLEI